MTSSAFPRPAVLVEGKNAEERDRLRAHLGLGEGFQLFFVACDSLFVVDAILDELEASPPGNFALRPIRYDEPSRMDETLERLLDLEPDPQGRRLLIVIRARGPLAELRAGWNRALVPLNEQRNRLIRARPDAIVVGGAPWLLQLVQSRAPDLWSVRTSAILLEEPKGSQDAGAVPPPEERSAFDHELREPEHYLALASAFEGTEREDERTIRLSLLLHAVDSLTLRGDYDRALELARGEAANLARMLPEAAKALTLERVARILERCGDRDEALRIRLEEEIPIYERSGEERSRAIAMGRVADALQARGELDEALRVRREEELPVYERLGDARERAVAMGKIADVLRARGDLSEALRICREEELPIYERLGDLRSRAIALGRIAGILEARGEADEALRIRREEVLPTFERLGDVRARAVTLARIANTLEERGELDEALRIHREEVLPVFERLGAIRELAVLRHNHAVALLEKEPRGNLLEARRLLGLALEDARRLRIPETAMIEERLRALPAPPE